MNCPQFPHLQIGADSGACTTAEHPGHMHATTFWIGGVVIGCGTNPGGARIPCDLAAAIP